MEAKPLAGRRPSRLRTTLYYWKHYYFTGERELLQLRSMVDPRLLAIDVGGNTGVYTYHLSRLARDVVTFEPNPDYADFLRYMRLKTRVEPVALSAEDGSAELRIPILDDKELGGMASLAEGAFPEDTPCRAVTVPSRRLDDYEFRDVGFIKIDVEGHEEAVLSGAGRTIRSARPRLLIEIEERSNPGGLARIRALLGDWGYEGWFFQAGRRRPITEFDPQVHQVWDMDVAEGKRRDNPYINNFFFSPAGT